ncbi:hypothetical protein K0M31_018517 [Melipona bicolor]|uniref:Uncharacterized protein n=1 Tax=Melipona bicolor TaxID=60889 RepID=A0AA40G3R3_9HYME|nr:hypothetical protein K0M31_018517 [Melipona bicolor]
MAIRSRGRAIYIYIYRFQKRREEERTVAVVERSGSAIRANVAAWNAYDNEAWAITRRGQRAGRDDVEPIETLRPDTKKVEGEEPDNRHRGAASYALAYVSRFCPALGRAALCLSALTFSPPRRRRKSRFARGTPAQTGARPPPTCEPPEPTYPRSSR